MQTRFLDLILLNDFLPSLSDQYAKYLQYLPLFLIFFFITLILTPIIGKMAKSLGIVNATKESDTNKLNKFENNDRRINPNSVPLLGGLAVVIPLIIAIPFLLGINPLTGPIIVSLLILILYGILDDIYNLPGTVQFAIQFGVALLVVTTIADVHFLQIPFDGIINLDWAIWEGSILGLETSFVFPGDLIAIFWIMICMNAVKWANGLDALMESNMIIAYLILFIIGVRTDAVLTIVISSILVGSLSSFTIFNFPPAKIFSAGTGAIIYGFLIATLALVNEAKFATTIIILLLPLVDFTFVLLKRLTIYKPKTFKQVIMTPIALMRMPDTNHLHHQLLKLNMTPKQVLLTEILLTLFIGSLAVLSAEAYRSFIVLIGGLLVGLAILLLHLLTHKKRIKTIEKEEEQETPESRYSY